MSECLFRHANETHLLCRTLGKREKLEESPSFSVKLDLRPQITFLTAFGLVSVQMLDQRITPSESVN